MLFDFSLKLTWAGSTVRRISIQRDPTLTTQSLFWIKKNGACSIYVGPRTICSRFVGRGRVGVPLKGWKKVSPKLTRGRE